MSIETVRKIKNVTELILNIDSAITLVKSCDYSLNNFAIYNGAINNYTNLNLNTEVKNNIQELIIIKLEEEIMHLEVELKALINEQNEDE